MNPARHPQPAIGRREMLRSSLRWGALATLGTLAAWLGHRTLRAGCPHAGPCATCPLAGGCGQPKAGSAQQSRATPPYPDPPSP